MSGLDLGSWISGCFMALYQLLCPALNEVQASRIVKGKAVPVLN
jgi:hypothetical protein